MVSNIIALIMLAFGLILLLWGFQYRQWLLPIISFFIGFTAAAGAWGLIKGESLLSTHEAWIAALAAGSIYTLMAFRFQAVGLVLMAGSMGYALIVYLLLALDINDGAIVAVAGLAGALTFALYSILYRKKKWFVTALTAAAGATSLLAGAILLFNQFLAIEIASSSDANPLLQHPLFWPTLVMVLAIAGYVAQSRSTVGEPKPQRGDIKASPV